MEPRGDPGWAWSACQPVCTEVCEELVREGGGVSPRCHICSPQRRLQTAGSVQRLQVCVPRCLRVAGWLWDYKVRLGPKMSPGRSQLLIPSLCNERPRGDRLARPLCTGSAQDELALSLITFLIVTRPPKSFQMEGEHVATWRVCSAPLQGARPPHAHGSRSAGANERAGNGPGGTGWDLFPLLQRACLRASKKQSPLHLGV